MKASLTASLLALLLLPAGAAEYYIAPDGKPEGIGSRSQPLDLATAISEKSPARPGDTLWLLEGVYKGPFTSALTGEPERRIALRQSPGERATIDGTLTVNGAWSDYRGFEVTNSDPDRAVKDRPPGLNVFGPHTRFINLVVHDAGVGVGFWTPAEDAEIYGCIIYHNGWQGPDPDRGHGHAIYMQNDKGTKRIEDNIMFNQYGWGIHAYTEGGSIKGFHIEGNMAFNNGSATRQGYRYDNILVGGYKPAERIAVIGNYTYQTPGKSGSNIRLHYEARGNKDLVCKDNYFAGGSPVVSIEDWQKVTMTGNTLYGTEELLSLSIPEEVKTAAYEWENNRYMIRQGSKPFSFQGQALDFAEWRQETGFDRGSRTNVSASGAARGSATFVRSNRYEKGRAHIVVYNWDRKDFVEADVSDILSSGALYEVRNVQDYFGKPVLEGTYSGQPLRLPMSGTETGPEFNVFVLTPGVKEP